jgi:hypothetical protein
MVLLRVALAHTSDDKDSIIKYLIKNIRDLISLVNCGWIITSQGGTSKSPL